MQILSRFNYAHSLAGLGFDGQYLWIGRGLDCIDKADTAGNQIGSWDSPGLCPYGMSYDGQYLWHSDWSAYTIYKLEYNNPTRIIDSFDISWRPSDLEWYRGHLCAIANEAYIYELEPTNMNIINSWPTGRIYSSGIAVGGGYLWFSNNGQQGWVFKVDGIIKVKEEVNSEPKKSREILSVSPNPFRHGIAINFITTPGNDVTIRIFSTSGRLVRELFRGNTDSAVLKVNWNGRDDKGRPVNSGIYFAHAETNVRDIYQKIILLK